MPLETTRFDVLDYLKTPEERLAYVEAAFEDGESMIITHTLSSVARSIGMNAVAKEAGMTTAALYKALSESDPPLSTLMAVIKALGLQLYVLQDERGAEAADLPPCGGDVRQDREGRCPAELLIWTYLARSTRYPASTPPGG